MMKTYIDKDKPSTFISALGTAKDFQKIVDNVISAYKGRAKNTIGMASSFNGSSKPTKYLCHYVKPKGFHHYFWYHKTNCKDH